MPVQQTYIYSTIGQSVKYENDYPHDHSSIRQSQLCTNQLPHTGTRQTATRPKDLIGRHTWHFNPSILRTSRLVQLHVNERMTVQLRGAYSRNERARNKGITRGRRGGYHTSRSRSLHSGIAGRLAHSTTYPQIFNQDLI